MAQHLPTPRDVQLRMQFAALEGGKIRLSTPARSHLLSLAWTDRPNDLLPRIISCPEKTCFSLSLSLFRSLRNTNMSPFLLSSGQGPRWTICFVILSCLAISHFLLLSSERTHHCRFASRARGGCPKSTFYLAIPERERGLLEECQLPDTTAPAAASRLIIPEGKAHAIGFAIFPAPKI